MRIYSIEGNIGSGKSTLLGKLKEFYKDSPRHVFVDEPVDEWIATKDADDGLNILEKYYADQPRYAFSFQVFAYITKLQRLMNAVETAPADSIIICERSLYTDRYVFAKMLYDAKKIENINYSIYLKWYDFFIERIKGTRHFIYVSTTPDICDKRIRRRNRGGESSIPIEYLRDCEKYHTDMISDLAAAVPSITLDGNAHKEDGDPWDTELAFITTFIDGGLVQTTPPEQPQPQPMTIAFEYTNATTGQIDTIPTPLDYMLRTYEGEIRAVKLEDYIRKIIDKLDAILSTPPEKIAELHSKFEINMVEYVHDYIVPAVDAADVTPDIFNTTFEYWWNQNPYNEYMITVCVNTTCNDIHLWEMDIVDNRIIEWCKSNTLKYDACDDGTTLIYL